jgi:protein-tyrosine phosphatase
LRDFDPIAPTGSEVPDPYYGGDAGFEEVIDLCEAACRGLIEAIRGDRNID